MVWCRIENSRGREIRLRHEAGRPSNAVYICRQAWYLERCGVAVTARAQRLRVKGAKAHQAIGRRTDEVRTIGRAQRVSGVLLAGLVIALVVVLARGLL